MRSPAASYRQIAAESASPLELVVMLYDRAIVDLQRAMTAVEAHDIQQRTNHLNHFFSILAQLEGSLDQERGGQVAKDLARFYQYARAQAFDASSKNSKEILSELCEHFSTLRDAWREGDRRLTTQTAQSTSPPAAESRPSIRGKSSPAGYSDSGGDWDDATTVQLSIIE